MLGGQVNTTQSGRSRSDHAYQLQASQLFTCVDFDLSKSLSLRTSSIVKVMCSLTVKQVAILNPTSGRGRGHDIFSKEVLPLLRDVSGLSVEVHRTTGKHHATQIVRELQGIDRVGVQDAFKSQSLY